MIITAAHNLACPIDGRRLEAREKQLICENGHCFDVARQGYVNLLPVQHKRSKHPGDSKQMVVARAAFLDSGVYLPIVNKLVEIILAQIPDNKEVCVMDAGCGEGYYLEHVFNALKDKDGDNDLSFIGLDISKDAIIAATKRNRQINWIVGTNRQPPVLDASVDIILCMFGFQSFEGFRDILKPGGKIILVEPATDHLKELREIIYSEVKTSEPQDFSHVENTGYSVIDSQPLQFKTGVINNQQVNNLLLMTPHLYRATKEGKEAAANLRELNLTADVSFSVLKKQV